MTHGPAMSASGLPAPISSWDVICTMFFDDQMRAAIGFGKRGADERAEQRVRLERFGFEFGMELTAEIPRMIFQLTNFDVDGVGSFTCEAQAVALEDVLIFAIEFVTMPMALADFGLAISRARDAAVSQLAGISAQAHGAAEL